jgi:hypothetical protein
MEFRCFVKGGNLRGICQRDVSNFYPYLPDEAASLEELLAVFWQEHVSGRGLHSSTFQRNLSYF